MPAGGGAAAGFARAGAPSAVAATAASSSGRRPVSTGRGASFGMTLVPTQGGRRRWVRFEPNSPVFRRRRRPSYDVGQSVRRVRISATLTTFCDDGETDMAVHEIDLQLPRVDVS